MSKKIVTNSEKVVVDCYKKEPVVEPLTPTVEEALLSKVNPLDLKIANAIRELGMDLKTACGFVGTSYPRYKERLLDCEEANILIENAKASFIAERVQGIVETTKQGAQYWLANAWLLERTQPDLYGQQKRKNDDETSNIIINFGEKGDENKLKIELNNSFIQDE